MSFIMISHTANKTLQSSFMNILPLMKPHKVWGETFGYQKRYRLVC